VLTKLHAWAKDKPNVRIIEGTWQERLSELGKFDCIFFDDYPGSGSITVGEIENSKDPRYAPIYMASGSHFHAFVCLCLEFHLKIDSRLTGYLEQEFSISRKDCTLTNRRIPVRPPPHCNYFIEKTAVVPLLTKIDPDDVREKTEEHIEADNVDSVQQNDKETKVQDEEEEEEEEQEVSVSSKELEKRREAESDDAREAKLAMKEAAHWLMTENRRARKKPRRLQ